MKSKKYKTPYELADAKFLHYTGDINLEYGGSFIDPSHWENHGYADVLRIDELPNWGLEIAMITVNRPKDMQECLEYLGLQDDEEITPLVEIEACLAYWGGEPQEDFMGTHHTVITTDPEYWNHDGLKASAHVDTGDLIGYIATEHMGGFDEGRKPLSTSQALNTIMASSLFRLDGHEIDLCEAIDALCDCIKGEEDTAWDLGEGGECDLASFLVGAYWAFSAWHAGQSSPEYATLCNLGGIYTPGPICNGPEPDSSEQCAYEMIDQYFKEKHKG